MKTLEQLHADLRGFLTMAKADEAIGIRHGIHHELARVCQAAIAEAERDVDCFHVADAVDDVLAAVARRARMREARAFVERMAGQGVKVSVNGNTVLAGPRVKVTPAVAKEIRLFKPYLTEVQGE